MLYFDVFSYPLTVEELFENSAVAMSRQDFTAELEQLLDQALLQRSGEFVLSPAATQADVEKRTLGNRGAEEIMPLAYVYSKKIGSFPFVEGVCLSGALSKKYYDEKGDIDYFIITKPGRLWICRTLLIMRYKLLPKALKKYWCVNYFISSDSLFIPDNNVFTGTELAYLIPTVNYSAYQTILSQNNWYKERFPNKSQLANLNCIDLPSPFFKSVIERILSGKFGQWVDNNLLSTTLKHWRKKYPEMDKEDFDLQFRSRKNVCKRHTHGYQNKVIKTWEESRRQFEQQFKVVL